MEDHHAALVHVAVFGHHHHAGNAAIQPVHGMERAAAQIVGHRASYRNGLLRQCRRVDGDPGGLVEDEKILILPENVQRVVHGDDIAAIPILLCCIFLFYHHIFLFLKLP